MQDKFWKWLAYRLPAQLVYWCAVRVAANATTGKFSNQIVPDLTAMDALKRFETELRGKKDRKPLTVVLLFAMIFMSIGFSAACPEKDKVRAAIDASYRLPAMTNDLINKVADARDRGIVMPDLAKTLGENLHRLAVAERTFVQLVKIFHDRTKANAGKVDAVELSKLRYFFDTAIIEPFLEVLEAAKLLTGTDVAIITTAVASVRLLIRTIAKGIGSSQTKLAAIPAFWTSNTWELS